MFVDYTGGFEDGEGVLGDEEKSANRLSLNRYFFDDRWTKNRVVTSMDWSVAYPELMCASYDKNPGLATNSVFPRLVVWRANQLPLSGENNDLFCSSRQLACLRLRLLKLRAFLS